MIFIIKGSFFSIRHVNTRIFHMSSKKFIMICNVGINIREEILDITIYRFRHHIENKWFIRSGYYIIILDSLTIFKNTNLFIKFMNALIRRLIINDCHHCISLFTQIKHLWDIINPCNSYHLIISVLNSMHTDELINYMINITNKDHASTIYCSSCLSYSIFKSIKLVHRRQTKGTGIYIVPFMTNFTNVQCSNTGRNNNPSFIFIFKG